MKVSENTSVAMPIKNMIGISYRCGYGYLCIHRSNCKTNFIRDIKRIIQADLLKKSEQTN